MWLKIGNGSIADADAHSFDVLTLTNSIEDITYTPSKRSDETAFLSKSKKGSQTVLSSGLVTHYHTLTNFAIWLTAAH